MCRKKRLENLSRHSGWLAYNNVTEAAAALQYLQCFRNPVDEMSFTFFSSDLCTSEIVLFMAAAKREKASSLPT